MRDWGTWRYNDGERQQERYTGIKNRKSLSREAQGGGKKNKASNRDVETEGGEPAYVCVRVCSVCAGLCHDPSSSDHPSCLSPRRAGGGGRADRRQWDSSNSRWNSNQNTCQEVRVEWSGRGRECPKKIQQIAVRVPPPHPCQLP